MTPSEAETIRHQVLLEGYKEQETEEYLLIIPLLFRMFTDELNALGITRISELTWARVKRLIRVLEKKVDALAKKRDKELLRHLRELVGQEAGFQREVLEKRDLSLGHQKTDRQLFAEVEDTPASADGRMLPEITLLWAAAFKSRIRGAVRRAWTEGMPTGDLIRQVRGTRGRRFLDGFGALLRRDIGQSVRSSVQHTSSVSRMSVLRRSPDVRQYRWVSVLDSRTSAICRSLDGRVFEYGKGPRPPAHLNCRSTISPVIPGEQDDGSRPTYYQWLQEQTPDFQKLVLGKTRAKLFQDSGMSAERFAQLNLDRAFQPRTLEQMKAVAPEVFREAGIPVE